MAKTTKDLPMNLWGTPVVLPAGTKVEQIGIGGQYAVVSTKLLIELTGNTHDPKYRYAFVPEDAVTA